MGEYVSLDMGCTWEFESSLFNFIYYEYMRVLRFIVNNQRIYPDPKCDFSGLVKGTTGYLKALFIFSPEWNGCKTAASFWRMEREYPVILKNNQCEIPPEALTWDYFSVSVTGVKDNGKYIITTGKTKVSQRG